MGEVSTIDLFKEAVGRAGQLHRSGLFMGSPMADGMWLSRKQRSTFHQPRLRRESYGELVQIDGSENRWFEERPLPG